MTTFALLSVSYFLYDYIAYLSFLYFRSVWLENTVFILLHELNIGWKVLFQKSFYPHLFERFLNKFLLGLLFHGFLCFWNLFPEKTAESDFKVRSHEIWLKVVWFDMVAWWCTSALMIFNIWIFKQSSYSIMNSVGGEQRFRYNPPFGVHRSIFFPIGWRLRCELLPAALFSLANHTPSIKWWHPTVFRAPLLKIAYLLSAQGGLWFKPIRTLNCKY